MINALKFLDKYLFRILAIILGIFTRKNLQERLDKNNNNKNILVIKLWAIGDSVNSLPSLKAIKDKNPSSKITVLTKKGLTPVYNQSFIDEILVAGPKNFLKMLFSLKKYDISIDMEPFLNSSAIMSWYLGKYRIGFGDQPRSRIYNYTVDFSKERHIVKTYMIMGKPLGVDIQTQANSLIKLAYSTKDLKYTRKILQGNKNYNPKKTLLIGICASVGDTMPERSWPKDNFRELCHRIIKKYPEAMIILFGTRQYEELDRYILGNDENIACRIVDTTGKLNLTELFAMIAQTKIFISGDTGPMHIAAAQGVKTIGLFGPNTPKIWAPYGKKNISIFHPAKGCPYMNNTMHELAPKRLTPEQKKCMEKITVGEVLRHI
jgi:heptosyltransferase II